MANPTAVELISAKLSVAANVYEQSTLDYKNGFKGKDPIIVFNRYTGVRAKDIGERRNFISFKDLLHFQQEHPIIRSNLTVSAFRNMLKKIYFVVKKIPSLTDLNNCEIGHKALSKDIPKTFLLKTLPGLTTGIVIEDPEIVYRRILYLKKMEQIRNSNAHMIYVRYITSLIRNKRDVNQTFFIAVSNRLGLLSCVFSNEDINTTINLILVTLTKVAEPCVIVIVDPAEDKEIPTPTTPKADMSSWLEKNGIVHDPKSHRGELYELVMKVKASGNVKNHAVDDVIVAQGHRVIRYPRYAEELDFYFRLSDLFLAFLNGLSDQSSRKTNTVQRASLIEFSRSLSVNHWQQLEGELFDREKLMYQEDILMEKFVDNLFTMAAEGNIPDDVKANLIGATDWHKIASTFVLE